MNSTNLDHIFTHLPASPEDECSYYPERLSSLKYAIVSEESINPSVVEEFTNRGYRRSGGFYYTTICRSCRMCIPYRIILKDLRFTESQRRNLKKNSNIQIQVVNPNPTLEKEEIYIRYIQSRHPDNLESKEGEWEVLDTMHNQMYSYTTSSWELEYYEEDRLVGFGILDIGEKSVSAVYNVYDPEYESRGLGTYMIAKSMDWIRSENLFTYYHLGLLIPGHPKMDYKRKFGPGEILHPLSKIWVPAESIL